LARTSTSRFDRTADRFATQRVRASVVGISPTVNASAVTATTVRLTPSTRSIPSRDVAGEIGGKRETNGVPRIAGDPFDESAGSVDVALHDVAAEPAAGGDGAFELIASPGRSSPR